MSRTTPMCNAPQLLREIAIFSRAGWTRPPRFISPRSARFSKVCITSIRTSWFVADCEPRAAVASDDPPMKGHFKTPGQPNRSIHLSGVASAFSSRIKMRKLMRYIHPTDQLLSFEALFQSGYLRMRGPGGDPPPFRIKHICFRNDQSNLALNHVIQGSQIQDQRTFRIRGSSRLV
jgi:hypothetical protein